MACGGLKSAEKKIDARLLNRHHSVRVTDFAVEVASFVKDFYRDKILSYRIAEFEYFKSKEFEHLIHKHKIKFFKFSEF